MLNMYHSKKINSHQFNSIILMRAIDVYTYFSSTDAAEYTKVGRICADNKNRPGYENTVRAKAG